MKGISQENIQVKGLLGILPQQFYEETFEEEESTPEETRPTLAKGLTENRFPPVLKIIWVNRFMVPSEEMFSGLVL